MLLIAGTACAQIPAASADRAHIRFTVENPQLEPSTYTLDVYKDGRGTYKATYTAAQNGDSAAQPVDRTIRIHDPLLSQLFSAARTHHLFDMDCQAPHSHVAFSGEKTFAYAGPEGDGSCTFNYSHDQSLNQLASDMISVAFTLEEGERLANEHLHDRLSLDAELDALQNAAQEHRALELGNIAPELESIADDDAVMNRARTRAHELLLEPASVR